MSNDDEDSLGLANEITRNIEEFFSGFHNSLFDVNEKYLKPLYRIESSEEKIRVIFDIPFVARRQDLNLNATEETLSIEAKTNKPVSMMVGGPYQKKLEFERYYAKIRLPVRVKPTRAKAKFRNGILVVEFPLGKSSRSVKIR